jgi:hypothetical protein
VISLPVRKNRPVSGYIVDSQPKLQEYPCTPWDVIETICEVGYAIERAPAT